MTFARSAHADVVIEARADALFAYLDEPRNLGGHMEQPSAMMLGGRMAYAFDAGGGRAVGSVISMKGDVLGIALALEETVVERTALRKVWQTRGEPRLLVIGAYRMGFEITSAGETSSLRVFIDYDLPERGVGRVLGSMFGGLYARWCVDRMAKDATRRFSKGG